MVANPYSAEHPVEPKYFAGRRQQQKDFKGFLDDTISGNPKNIAVLGDWGIGKTSLLKATMAKDTILAGEVSIETTTGNVGLSWTDINVSEDIVVDLKTTTGGVDMDLAQYEALQGDITLKVEVTTGGIDFRIDIKDDIGAKIISSTTTGGIDVGSPVGFTETGAVLKSNNYPASHNIDVALKTTTGGIDINASHTG